MKAYTWKNKKYIVGSIVVLLLLWSFLSYEINNEIIIPSIKSTFDSLIEIVKDPFFAQTLLSTITRLVISFSIALGAAICLGIITSFSKLLYNFMIPILYFLKAVPSMAIIVLVLIWLSNSSAPILIGIIMVFPILFESVFSGISNVDNKILDMARLYKVNKKTIIKDIYIPNILMNINGVIASAMGLGFKVIIASEVLGQPKYSIGNSLQLEKMYLNTSGVFAWIIIIVLISAVLENIIKLLYKKIYFWK